MSEDSSDDSMERGGDRGGALFDDDVLSMTPSEIDRQLEEEMAR